tara:strand:- start:294 stop:1541 length:1248 start_codon:yes stop_codon:yes gene_type:complete
MLKSKYLISIVLVFFILFVGWKGVNHIIGNDKFSKIKSIIPEKHQTFIKKYFFVDKFTRDLVSKYETKENDILSKILKSQITFNKKTTTELSKIRKNIIKNHILDDEQILIENYNKSEKFLKINFPEILNDLKRIQFEISIAKYYELKSHALLFKSEKNCSDNDKNLIISIGGHNGSRKMLNELGSNILKNILSECNDFLILDMSLKGMNSINRKDDIMQKNYLKNDTFFPGYKSKTSMTHHKVFSLFKDNKYPNKKPLSLMLSGNYYLLKKIIENNYYNKISMFGKSGGAWETLLLATIIPQIDESISFSGGTIPLIYRVNDNLRHFEGMEKNFFNDYSYIDLFLLATHDKDFVVNRKNYHIYNLTDPCCYTGTEILGHFKKSFQAENFYIKFFKSDKHEINKQILLDILKIYN